MKLTLVMLLASFNLFANIGFECQKGKVSIQRAMVNGQLTLEIVEKLNNSGDVKTTYNPDLVLPNSDSTDDYQNRFAIYYELMNVSQQKFGYMPEALLIFHIMKSTEKYKKGFRAFENIGESVELSKMYCEKLVEAIKEY